MVGQKESRDSDRKKIRCLVILEVLFFVTGFAFLIWGCIRQDHGVLHEADVIVMLTGCFFCMGLVIFLLTRSQPYLTESAFEKMNRYYDEKELTELWLTGREELEERLLRQKFRRLENGYYTRARFTFWKDRVWYYVRVIEEVDVVSAIQREADRFDRMGKIRKNFCILLFLYMDQVDEYEKETIRNFGKNEIIAEEFLQQSPCSLLVVAVDEHTDTGYFLDIEKKKPIVLYSYGSEMLREIAGIKK